MKKLVLSTAFAVIGTFAMAQQTQMKHHKNPAQMEQKRQDHMREMEKELKLSKTQVAQLQALHDRQMAERKQMRTATEAQRKARVEQMKAKREGMSTEMRQILTPEQYQRWETMRKEKMQDKRMKMQHKDGMMHRDHGTMQHRGQKMMMKKQMPAKN